MLGDMCRWDCEWCACPTPLGLGLANACVLLLDGARIMAGREGFSEWQVRGLILGDACLSCAGVCGFWGIMSGLGGCWAPVGAMAIRCWREQGWRLCCQGQGEQWVRPWVTGGLLWSRRHFIVEWVHCRAAALAGVGAWPSTTGRQCLATSPPSSVVRAFVMAGDCPEWRTN
jgi:hypothetical protein